jgi:hypothetical protein
MSKPPENRVFYPKKMSFIPVSYFLPGLSTLCKACFPGKPENISLGQFLKISMAVCPG